MLWTRETVIDLDAERKRRESQDERRARVLLYPPSGNVVVLPTRPPVDPPSPDGAA